MHPMIVLACVVAIGLSALVIGGTGYSFYYYCYSELSGTGIGPAIDYCVSKDTNFYYSLIICGPIVVVS